MKLLNVYTEGFKKTFGSLKIVTIIYGITLLIGIIFSSSFNSIMTDNFSSRNMLYMLFRDFDFTVYSDFMNNYGDIINSFTSIMIWFGMFYFFFSVFFAGGILKFFEGSTIKSKTQNFFAGSSKFFFRFLRLGIYVLLIQLIIFGIIALIFSAIFNNASKNSAEPALFTILMIWLAIHIIFFIFLSIVSDYAKIILVKEDSKKVWRALWGSFKFTLKKLYLTYPLYIILSIVPAVLFILYFWLDSAIGMHSGLTILLMFLIQQIFIWVRLFAKVWILGSQYEFFNNHLAERTKPLLTQEILMNEEM